MRNWLRALTVSLSTMALICVGNSSHGAAVLAGTVAWPNGVVYYRFDDVLLKRAHLKNGGCPGEQATDADTQVAIACRAMIEWHETAGVQFEFRGDESADVLVIKDGPSTTSTLGYHSTGNVITILEGDIYGHVLHEYGHLLGLMHEHQRPDRDSFITLKPILEGYLRSCDLTDGKCRNMKRSFAIAGPLLVSSDYDPCSIMHYGPNLRTLHPELDPAWERVFDLTDPGKAHLDACMVQFKNAAEHCKEVGQDCAISRLDADVVRRFYGLKHDEK